jgi:hypothetical protein
LYVLLYYLKGKQIILQVSGVTLTEDEPRLVFVSGSSSSTLAAVPIGEREPPQQVFYF